MKGAAHSLGLLLAFFVALNRPARAQEERARNVAMLQRRVDAPRSALELRASAGYSQGVGSLDANGGETVQDVANVGGGIDIGIGFRATPHFSIGTFASAALYSPVAPDASVRTLAGGIEAAWHFRPYRALDPWISLGVGYRAFWETPPDQSTTVWQGFDIGRLGIGVDYRLGPTFAVGPAIVADLTYFQKKTSGSSPTGSIGGALGAFVSAGVGIRFDAFGQSSAATVAEGPPIQRD
jgi:hypothetical protein